MQASAGGATLHTSPRSSHFPFTIFHFLFSRFLIADRRSLIASLADY
jgi:hypothetical protein